MGQTQTITMTMRALDRMKVIQALIDGHLKPKLAAGRLGLTVRQVRRLANQYCEEGPSGLVSRRCNRPSNNHMAADITGLALRVIRERYADFGPTFACEKLCEGHGLLRSKETVRKAKAQLVMHIDMVKSMPQSGPVPRISRQLKLPGIRSMPQQWQACSTVQRRPTSDSQRIS